MLFNFLQYLRNEDNLGIVLFDHKAEVFLPLTPIN